MCETIIINNGDKELRTVNEFKEFFGGDFLIPENAIDVTSDCCLCQIDIQKELKKRNIPFEFDGCDYNVMIEDLEDKRSVATGLNSNSSSC